MSWLDNIVLAVLNANHISVGDKIQLRATSIIRKAITQGDVDIYWKYTGNAAIFFNKTNLPICSDPGAAYQTVQKSDYDVNKIVWLKPAGPITPAG